jgi:hypothetical protein
VCNSTTSTRQRSNHTVRTVNLPCSSPSSSSQPSSTVAIKLSLIPNQFNKADHNRGRIPRHARTGNRTWCAALRQFSVCAHTIGRVPSSRGSSPRSELILCFSFFFFLSKIVLESAPRPLVPATNPTCASSTYVRLAH